jgi:hypothetical protein
VDVTAYYQIPCFCPMVFENLCAFQYKCYIFELVTYEWISGLTLAASSRTSISTEFHSELSAWNESPAVETARIGLRTRSFPVWPTSTFVMCDLRPVTMVTNVTNAQLTCIRDQETMALDCQRSVRVFSGVF